MTKIFFFLKKLIFPFIFFRFFLSFFKLSFFSWRYVNKKKEISLEKRNIFFLKLSKIFVFKKNYSLKAYGEKFLLQQKPVIYITPFSNIDNFYIFFKFISEAENVNETTFFSNFFLKNKFFLLVLDLIDCLWVIKNKSKNEKTIKEIEKLFLQRRSITFFYKSEDYFEEVIKIAKKKLIPIVPFFIFMNQNKKADIHFFSPIKEKQLINCGEVFLKNEIIKKISSFSKNPSSVKIKKKFNFSNIILEIHNIKNYFFKKK